MSGNGDLPLRVVGLIGRAAAQGCVCPTNAELAAWLRVRSTATVVRAMQAAEARGLIRVTRGPRDRVVAAADGAWRTHGHGKPAAPSRRRQR